MQRIAVLAVIILVLAAAWFFVSPLFIDESVDEGLEFVLDGGGVDMQAVMAMPESKRMEMKTEIMEAAAAAPDSAANDTMLVAGPPTVVAQD